MRSRMSAYQRSARRALAAAVLAVAAVAATGPQPVGTPVAATAAAPPDGGSAPAARAAQAPPRPFPGPTTSSPITLSRDGRLAWVVNPGADTVSVIATATNTVVRSIGVGDEPQSVALDPSDRFAFVANA